MKDDLNKIIFTLNSINVHGERDLSCMLGCIQELNRLVATLEQTEECKKKTE